MYRWLSIYLWIVNKMHMHCQLWVSVLMTEYWCISRYNYVLYNDVHWCSSYSQFCSWIAKLEPILSHRINLTRLWTCVWSASFLTGRWSNNALLVLSQCHWQMSSVNVFDISSFSCGRESENFCDMTDIFAPVSNSAVVACCWTVMWYAVLMPSIYASLMMTASSVISRNLWSLLAARKTFPVGFCKTSVYVSSFLLYWNRISAT